MLEMVQAASCREKKNAMLNASNWQFVIYYSNNSILSNDGECVQVCVVLSYTMKSVHMALVVKQEQNK